MSKSKRKKKYHTQQKSAPNVLENSDLDKNASADVPRRRRAKREWFPSSGGGFDGADFFGVLGFLILWAVCSAVEYGVYTTLWTVTPYTLIFAIITGLCSAGIVLGVLKGGGGFDVTNWW